jgi:spore germination cell wall hydrolase CwlJ-like protein
MFPAPPVLALPVPLFADEALAVATIWAEARSEPLQGQIAVAEVIRNRMERRYSSNGTVAGTVLRPYQFSCFGDGTAWRPRIFGLKWDDPEVHLAQQAWKIAMGLGDADERSNVAGGAVLYHTIAAPSEVSAWPPRWARTCAKVATIGRHIFYDDKER